MRCCLEGERDGRPGCDRIAPRVAPLCLEPIVTRGGGGVEFSFALANGWLAELRGAFTSCSASGADGRNARRSSSIAAASLVAGIAATSAVRLRKGQGSAGPGAPTTLAIRTRDVLCMRPRRRRDANDAPERNRVLAKARSRRMAAKYSRPVWSRSSPSVPRNARCAWGIGAAHGRSMT